MPSVLLASPPRAQASFLLLSLAVFTLRGRWIALKGVLDPFIVAKYLSRSFDTFVFFA